MGSDTYDIGLSGQPGEPITVADVINAGDLNQLAIFGANAPEYYLLRANQTLGTGVVASYAADANGQPITADGVERVNYDGTINGGRTISGGAAGDTFVLDDTLAPTTIFGDAGNDTFQVGQVFQSARDGTNPDNGLDPLDYFATTQTTDGFLSNGVSFATTLYGGDGDDTFVVDHNLAELWLYGQDGDDTFTVQAFVKVNPNDPNAPFTNINGGAGADFISYTVDAPVRIDGGDGLDTVVVIGTDFGDTFVITDQGIFGAGLYVSFTNIEKVIVDGGAGNDTFYVQSTSPTVDLELVGGQGSDTFDIGGSGSDQPITVVSNSLNGHSGLVANLVDEADAASEGVYAGVTVPWISANVADADAPGVVISQSGQLQVFEGANMPQSLVVNTYTVVLTQAPTKNVLVTATATPPSLTEEREGVQNVFLNGQLGGTTLVFTSSNWFIPQLVTVTVAATPDGVATGNRALAIQHTVVEGSSAIDGDPYDGIPVQTVGVDVIDADTQSVVIAPYDPTANNGHGGITDGVLISDGTDTNVNATVSATGEYAVVLTKAPSGPVTLHVSSDGETMVSTNGIDWFPAIDLTFTGGVGGDWNTLQLVYVEAATGTGIVGIHFSRILDHGHLRAAARSSERRRPRCAAGLADAVAADPTGQFQTSSSGNTLTIVGPAFTASWTSGSSLNGLTIAAGSQAAFSGQVTAPIGPSATGDVWTLTVDGGQFVYAVPACTGGACLTDALNGLVAEVNQSGTYHATTSGNAVLVSRRDGSDLTVSLTHQAAGSSTVTNVPVSGTPSLTTWAKLVLLVSPTGTVPLGDTWTVTLDRAGASSASAVQYAWVAGAGSSTLVAPQDVEVTDSTTADVLVIQPGGSTNVIEPTSFVVVGEGFIDELSNSGCAIQANQPITCFNGSIGTSQVNSITFHNSLATAQDLDLGSWGLNNDPNILNPTTTPHLTVDATGTGANDYYKLDVTTAMVGQTETFDIDAGQYILNGKRVWASHLLIYDANGNLLASGPGHSLTTQGAGGSTDPYDDFLTYSFATAGEYYVEVSSWQFANTIPNGVTYELQVSAPGHTVAGFVFAPAPVQSNSLNNSLGSAQNVDPNTVPSCVQTATVSCTPTGANFYNFYNTSAGDAPFGGSIDWQTPYAEIQGAGDGSLDVYSFEITPAMLNPVADTIDDSTAAANGPFYTSLGLNLTGTVLVGDVWTLGLRDHDYSYTVQPGDPLTLAFIAQTLASMLNSSLNPVSGYTATASGNSLTITNPNGFNLTGNLLSGGIADIAQQADTVTTSTSAVEADGSTAIDFTSANVTLAGTATPGELWTLTVGSSSRSFMVTAAGATLADIAADFASHLGGSATGSSISFTSLAGVPLSFSVSGITQSEGYATISGTSVTGQTASVPWSQEQFTLPTATPPNEAWTVSLSDTDGGSPVSSGAVLSQTTGAQRASALVTALSGNGYGVSAAGNVLTISRTTPFLDSIAVTPSGSATTGTASEVTVTVTAASTDTWEATLSDSGSLDTTLTGIAGGSSTSGVAQSLAAAISGISGFTAIAQGAKLTITRLTGGAFSVSIAADPSGTFTKGAAFAAVVTIAPFFTSSEDVTLTLDSTPYTVSNETSAGNAASGLGEPDRLRLHRRRLRHDADDRAPRRRLDERVDRRDRQRDDLEQGGTYADPGRRREQDTRP